MPALLDSNRTLDRKAPSQEETGSLAGAALDVLELDGLPGEVAPISWEEEEEDEDDDEFLDDEDDLDLGDDDEEFIDDDEDDEDLEEDEVEADEEE